MLRARITVDLPATEVSDARRRLGRRNFDVTVEEAGAPTSSIVKGLFGGFAATGVSDVLSFLVDQEVIFVDFLQVDGDLEAAFSAWLDRGTPERPFEEMRLVASQRGAGLHVVFDAVVRRQGPLGEPEMSIEVSARPDELEIRAGERADEYAARVARFSAAGFRLDAQRHALDGLVTCLAGEIARRLVCESVVAQQARIEIVRPTSQDLAALERLPFGDGVEEVTCRPLPPAARRPDEDPFGVHYGDPYWMLTNYLLLTHVVRDGHLCSPDVWIVDGEGYQIATGDDSGAIADDGWNSSALAIGFGVRRDSGDSMDGDLDEVAEQWLATEDDPDTRSVA